VRVREFAVDLRNAYLAWKDVNGESGDIPARAGNADRAIPKALVQSLPAPVSVADELSKLATLRDKGLLAEEEFSVQKAKLLN
jgi:hypothetical protein